ncbi:hypothetical protein OG338_23910 [Streptomyces sp. NBC_00726]|uniref:hypothetical protein n=1 Tax=Streptomyces sp. NBC_00726 TaxID=2903674 RepID=UPI003868696C
MTETLEDVLDRARVGIDRSEALGEAQVAVLEAASILVRAGRPGPDGSAAERAELLREALASVRAATVATGIAVVAHRPGAAQLPGALPASVPAGI